MANRNHIVHKQCIEMAFSDMTDTHGLPQRIGELFSEKIQPGMQRLFDRYCADAYAVSLEQLEVDCGSLPFDRWEEAFVESALHSLEEQLRSIAAQKVHYSNHLRRSAGRAWLFFLEQGHFSWDSPADRMAELEPLLKWDEALIEQSFRLFGRTPHALRRLMTTCTPKFRAGFITQVMRCVGGPVTELFGALPSTVRSSSWFQETVLAAISQCRATHGPRRYEAFAILLPQLFERGGASVNGLASDGRPTGAWLTDAATAVLVKQLPALTSKLNGPRWQPLLTQVAASIQPTRPDLAEKLKASIRSAATGPEATGGNKRLMDQEPVYNNMIAGGPMGSDATGGAVMTKTPEEQEEYDIYINNAGLVLLHPYIASLLEATGLTKDHAFAADGGVASAVLLLQYLITGEEQPDESILPLNKILCGLSPQTVVDVGRPLHPQWKAEGEELLQAVTAHWKALKNTSIEGLRETFLRRPGKVRHAPNGWQLHIEVKTVDVLLNSLPWGMSIVRLPWMDELLYVSWI
ncbi:contractile injection system tape measure protein [Parapedobacter sp. DT-150]|uniref:contractile injection system tape measure protein n=1 Tax=Parapedobacter sp. DT-150 TaxID=3396162 RepID=UPI003F1C0FC9